MNLHDLNPSTRNWAGGNTAEWYVNLRPGYDAWTAPNNVVGHDAHGIVARLERAWGLLRMAHLENEGFAVDGDAPRVAGRYADTIVRLPGKPHGPAYARNRAFEVSRGDIIIFIDSDVVVHPDTVRRFVEYFERHADVGAVFGSYDDRPPAPGFMSQYRNLLHHYTHQRNAGEGSKPL